MPCTGGGTPVKFQQRFVFRLCPHAAAIILLAAILLIAAGCAKGPEEKAQPKSAEVTVIAVEARDVPVTGEYVA